MSKDKAMKVEDFYVRIPKGERIPAEAQSVDGKWYAPKFGCDTLQTMIECIEADKIIERKRIEEAFKEMVKDSRLKSKPSQPYKEGWNDALRLLEMKLDNPEVYFKSLTKSKYE